MRYKIQNQNETNFLTITIVEWIDLFTRSVYSDIIIDSLRFCQHEKGLKLYAFVIMPSHIHLIASTEAKTGLSRILQDFKSYTAKKILRYIEDYEKIESRRTWLLNHFATNAKKHSNKSNYQVWKKGNHPITLYSPKVIRQKLAYIHNNPVAAKIVYEPQHYVYSSASNYLIEKGILDVEIWIDDWNGVGYSNMGTF